MGDVYEYLVDGSSGLTPGSVEGTALVAGVCSVGTVGKGYLMGPDSDVEDTLGVGPLADAMRDVLATAGQDAVVIAVPVTGQSGGYISNLAHTGTGPDAAISGVAAANADVVVRIAASGALGTATYELSLDGGDTYTDPAATESDGQVTISATGTTLVLGAGDQVAGDTYSYVVRTPIGPISKVGDGPSVSASGDPLAAAQVELVIVSGGGLNEGTYKLSVDGGDNYGSTKTIPLDGALAVGSTGVTITFADDTYVTGDTYTFDVLAPVPTITDVIDAIETPLELYDVEFVYVVGPSDSVDWAAVGVVADELWDKHRPTFFKLETRMPYDDEDIDDWVAALVEEQADFSHRFVQVIAAYGEVVDSSGYSKVRNWAGLQAGRVIGLSVQRAAGRVRDGGISQGTLPDDYKSAHQSTLEDARYVTARTYAGLSSAYWGDSKTMAEDTSDYQYEPVLRTVFKAVRLGRKQALKSMYDEVGDALLGEDASGLAYLKANLEHGLDSMVAAIPQELAAYVVTIPAGQDIVNNGVAVTYTLIGIPIIRKISLYARYVYAGSSFDPRMESEA
ncbi:MAG: hypothetical protein PWQ57_910 [Desulfovibrionales bacterium]|nr:hypothetical protein [Desulfovibrionales bacterium]